MRRLPSVLIATAYCLLATGLLAACGGDTPVAASLAVSEAMAGDTAGYARATEARPFVWPADHGPHPAFKTEWWYATGNLRATDGTGRRFGYQFTIFRSALAPDTGVAPRASGWAARQLYLAHVALSDLSGGEFYAAERFARGAAGLAGAQADPLRVWLGPNSLTRGEGQALGGAPPLTIRAVGERGVAYALDLRPEKPPVLQGERGLSRKGPEPGNASFYYSLTRLATTGTVTVGGETIPVEGLSWLDREWSTSALGKAQVGWDWFALHLEDGRDLMLYRLRRRDGTADPLSRATLVAPDGSSRSLDATEFSAEPAGTWRSPRGGSYPARWRIRIPSERLDLTVVPLLADQELNVTIRYWEGAVGVEGTGGGRPVSGHGYLEMTGYAEAAEASARAVPGG